MRFDLIEESWIPCETRSSERVELGIAGLFRRAHELRAVHDASPLATVAIYRLLLAILHRVFGPASMAEWKALYRRGAFDMDSLGAYLETWRARFDLLHPERPFYQARGLRDLGYGANGVERLVFERSNYGAAVHVFQHRPSRFANDWLSFAAAARTLLALQAFAPGGLVKKAGEPGSASASPLNRGAVVLVRGETLFETLILNLVQYRPDDDLPVAGKAELDLPSWEQPALARPVGDREPHRYAHGWIDRLTWQSRRVELTLNAESSHVEGVIYCVGHGLDEDPASEPMVATGGMTASGSHGWSFPKNGRCSATGMRSSAPRRRMARRLHHGRCASSRIRRSGRSFRRHGAWISNCSECVATKQP